jgi:hypothetical protein
MADEMHVPGTGFREEPVRSVGEAERTALVRALATEHPAALSDWLATTVLDMQTVAWLNQQGLGPYIYYRLRDIGLGDRIATDTMTALRARYLHTVADNALILDGASTWAARFSEAGIPAVWIKGVSLSHTIYPHPGLRPMSDIDVVIRRSDRGRALALVEKLTGQRAGTLAEHSGMHACFEVGRHNRVRMEVHWSLL